MPNHITNILTIKGDMVDVANCLSFISNKYEDGKPQPIDFNKIIPRPKSLDITSGSNVDKAIAIINNDKKYFENMLSYPWVQNEGLKSAKQVRDYLLKTLSQQDLDEGRAAINNIKKHGHKDWYSWSNAKWGTKWNAYDQMVIEFGTIQFDTAWSTPFPVMQALAQKFPNLCFEVKFADEDLGSNCGAYKFENGQLTGEYIPKDIDALRFACEIKDIGFNGFIVDNFGYWEIDQINKVKEVIKEMVKDGMTPDLLNEIDLSTEDGIEKAKFLKNIAVEIECYEDAAELKKLIGN